ncbi:calcium-binding protein [Microvirga rosea]|uniref:calcium-binding protein n=1 Tax=Microvirga rosea TaxID=2715425 RepID=UPI001D09CD7E|nr:calcium-binding protein [Microvirga rosea]MCB8821687.1 hypothetical protein [Microvirga rosea]
MATYDPVSNTYTLTAQEQNYTLSATDIDASIIGNALDNLLTGNDTDNALDGQEGKDTLIGGKGDDLYVLRAAETVITELADEGDDAIISFIDIDLNDYANVEHVLLDGTALNAIGNDGDNQIYGNDLDNILDGGKGHDTLDGGDGADIMIGGLGNDVYYLNDAKDTVIEAANSGDDTVFVLFDYSLVGTEIENIELMVGQTATGNDYNNRLIGNAESNILDGGKGDDTLDGGFGEDDLKGGEGDDVYVVDNPLDLITELDNQGTDTVKAFIDFSLEGLVNVENLTLVGFDNIGGTGNALSNTILGNDGNNILDGKAGADALSGGKGDDTYVIDVNDDITEATDEGRDTIKITDVFAPNTYTLKDNFENLLVTGTRDFDASGNALNNQMTGNGGANTFKGDEGNDTLDGGGGGDRLEGGKGEDMLIGGTGADVMIGGADNDLYFVDSKDDVVTEDANGGTFDRVISKISYTLASNVEYLALENAGGNISGTGNSLDNTMFGNDGSNILDGGSGRDQLYGATGADTVYGGEGNDSIHEAGNDSDALYGGAGDDSLEGEGGNDFLDGGIGADHLKGGAGNDTYLVDSSFDIVTDAAGNGVDTVQASATFTLSADAEVEVLQALGSAALNLTGSASANRITGNAASNTLKGQNGNDVMNGAAGNDKLWGGFGTDVLTGGTGKDIFIFDAALNKKTNLDKIADFNVKDDTIWLDNAIFKKLGKGTELKPGKLNKAFFTIGTKAKDKNDYLIYDNKKGILYYDADGSGKGKAMEIATLKKSLKMTIDDFKII